jgi:hypothetical protein
MVKTVRDTANKACYSHPVALLPLFLNCGISGFASHSREWFALIELNFDVYAPSQIIAVAFNENRN